MARENTVYLYGRLIADPKNRMDKENNPISSKHSEEVTLMMK